MDAVELELVLGGKQVILAGGRDREGRPIIIANTSPDLASLDKALLAKSISYVLSILSEDTRSRGVSLVVDAQRSNWRLTRACVRQILQSLHRHDAVNLIVVRPEAFWDKRVDNCTRIHRHGEPLYLPLSRLNKYVDPSQLTEQLGGTLNYDHQQWINSRIRVERFFKMNSEAQCELERVTRLLTGARDGTNNASRTMTQTSATYNNTCHLANALINDGRSLLEEYGVDRITETIGQDVLDTRARVERQLTLAQTKLVALHQAWNSLNKSITDAKEVCRLEAGVRNVTEWLLATGEALLMAHNQVGYDIASAEQLRREHEALELHCRDTYGQYAELLHKLDQCAQNGVTIPEDLKSQRDFMDFICRSFATRLERRRNILITSARFFRLVSEYFQTTSEVYENLVMTADLEVLDKAHCTLMLLQESQANIDLLEEAVVREGEKLSDLLAMPVKDALGREISVDYEADIVNVTEILDMTNARSELFRDSVELQRITLRQASHVYEYEKDATQAIEWLEDLFQVMLKSHCEVGCNVIEIQQQKEEHQAFQETAKGTYEYGCQLLSAALSLRQYCKLGEGDNTRLCAGLTDAWHRLQSAAHHHMTRLRVTAVLHRTLDQNCKELEELMTTVRCVKGGDGLCKLLQSRERLLIEVARMLRLARLLKSRLREPLCSQQPGERLEWNRSAVDAISERVAEVTALAEELDAALCGKGDNASPHHNHRTSVANIVEEILVDSPPQEDWYASLEKRSSSGKTPGNSSILGGAGEESSRSEEEFATASECTCTPPSRSSSYHTASEGEPSYICWQSDSERTPQHEVVTAVVTQEVRETRKLKLSRDGCSIQTDRIVSETCTETLGNQPRERDGTETVGVKEGMRGDDTLRKEDEHPRTEGEQQRTNPIIDAANEVGDENTDDVMAAVSPAPAHQYYASCHGIARHALAF